MFIGVILDIGEQLRSIKMSISKVLIVDDDSSIRRIAELSLAKVGKMKVAIAESGKQALELLDKMVAENSLPDTVLMDVMMPGMDGIATFSEIKRRAETAMISVIFMTAKVQKQEVESYHRIGATGVIIKPFDPMTLAAEVSNICAHPPSQQSGPRHAYRRAI